MSLVSSVPIPTVLVVLVHTNKIKNLFNIVDRFISNVKYVDGKN